MYRVHGKRHSGALDIAARNFIDFFEGNAFTPAPPHNCWLPNAGTQYSVMARSLSAHQIGASEYYPSMLQIRSTIGIGSI
ncbi:hypothetical protein SCLCIDRAFT_1216442 [Scleroderma citrinum Foug A]|uniref:Uncharacterized protein n=1 Tax=Scleroderma citrinum Foug A TaxID=1036808 RepID=A0A0C3DXQ9_9AGAM|nr:hypothetical protein SCLCIDRAFT_1216442 [Scleroderma citrinum Foug A]